MKTDRECDLAYLSFESDVLMMNITFDDFYKAWTSKSRAGTIKNLFNGEHVVGVKTT